MRKTLLLLTAVLFSMASAFAQSGTTGPLTWNISGNTLTISGNGAMPNYTGTSAPWYSYSFNTVIIDNGVTSIGQQAFYYCTQLTSINIGNSVTLIGSASFWHTQIASIAIPSGVTNITFNAFYNCSYLASFTVDNNNTVYASESGVLFNKSKTTLIQYPMAKAGTSYEIPNSVTAIGDNAFYQGYISNLTSIIIPNSVTNIGEYAFSGCYKLTSIIIPNSVTNIGAFAFSGCSSATSITIGNNVTTIGYQSFQGCNNFIYLTIPNSVSSIGSGAFLGCTNLQTINYNAQNCTMGINVFDGCSILNVLNIGENVQSIPWNAFYNCTTLNSITTNAIIPPSCGYAFYNTSPNIPVHIPCFSYLDYTNADGWNHFTNFIINGIPTLDTTTYYFTKCYNIPYWDDNFTIPIDQPGTYYTSISNANNCDSIICLILSEYSDVPDTHYSTTFCTSSIYSDNNFTNLTQPGDYQTILSNANNCDSIVYLHLTHPISPAQNLCMISVDNSCHNEIVWKRQEEIVSYNIYREGLQVGNYELAANIPYESPNTWVDMESNARIRSYRYKIAGVDTCGVESVLSESHKTMHLTINAGQGNSWNLIWTAYEGTYYSTYNIYRAKGNANGPGTFELIGTMPAGNTSYSDFPSQGGYVYYMVEIMLNESCDLGKAGSSIKSNIATNAPVGIGEITQNSNFTISPNPTTGELTITNYELGIGTLSEVEVEIFDIYGKKQSSNHLIPSSSNHHINISHLSAGIYFLKIGNETVKVVKQ